jgi:hypothetical protein
MIPIKKLFFVGLVGGSIAGLTAPAEANMVLSYQDTAGGLTGNGAFTGFSSNGGSGVYSDTFTAPTPSISGSPSPGYGFYDDFYFSVPNGVTADSITSTISLGQTFTLSNLQVRLYNSANNSPPVLGAPSGGVTEAWSSPITIGPGMTGTVQVLNTQITKPGTYVLEVRGTATGTNGGSYAGTLNVSPVPLPAALPLLLTGFGLFAGAMRKRAAT